MVEQERLEGRVALNSETYRVLETTLAELGVDTTFDNLNLGSDRFTLGVKQIGEDTVFTGSLNHGLAGGHFAQFLNNVAPFPYQDLRGIIDDINLPILAERDYQAGRDRTTSEYIRLHERHRDDPRVGPTYIRFAEDHADSWLMALEFGNGSEVFDRAQGIRFINSTEDIRRELISEDGNLAGSLNDSRILFELARLLQAFQHKRFSPIGEKVDKEAVKAVLKSFTREEQIEFATSYFARYKGQVLVDLDSQKIIDEKSYPNNRIRLRTSMNFADNGRDVVIKDGRGTKVVLSPTGQNSERFSWKAVEYQFPEGYKESSRYPIIAWKKDGNGTRTFLTQLQAMPLVRELGLPEGEQGDAKLGEITVASFARHIIKDWEPKMTLKPLPEPQGRFERNEQEMRGAQMPAWVAIEQHKAELLRSETSPLAIMEKSSGLAA